MAERTDELKDRRSQGLNVDDEMLDPLDDTIVTVVTIDNTDLDDDVTDYSAGTSTADIEQTRAQMGQTIGAIQEKLRPQTLAQQAKDALSDVGQKAKDTLTDVTHTAVHNVVEEAKGAYHGVMDPVKDTVENAVSSAKGATMSLYQVVRANPLPLAMAGMGLYWFYNNMHNRETTSRTRYYPSDFSDTTDFSDESTSISDQVKDKASQVKDKAGQAMDTLQDKASQIKDKAADKLSQVTTTAQNTMRSGVDSVQHLQQESPFVIGAMALVAGAFIGLMLPQTEAENRMMGETKERLTQKVSESAQDLRQKVSNVAHETLDTAKETMKQEAQQQGLTSTPAPQPSDTTAQPSVAEVMGV